jgi:protein required for attachment to host cells
MIQTHPTWVLVADAKGARIFSHTGGASEWKLQETVAGDGSGHPDQTGDFGPKASLHKGALHAHGAPVTKETEERRFAHTLAHVLQRGFETKAFANLVLAAPPKLLGDLRENLSRGVQGAVRSEFDKDYTHSGVKELMQLLETK